MLTPDERATLTAISRRLTQRHDAISADTTLSPHGKRIRRAREQLAAEAASKKIIETAEARSVRASKDAYSRAFGLKASTAGGVEAERKARDRAAKLDTPAAALRALAQAELRGDGGMSRAIAERAWEFRSDQDLGGHWQQVLIAYAEADPQRNQALGALAEASERGGLGDRLWRDMLVRPPDLKMGSIEALAAEAEPQPAGST